MKKSSIGLMFLSSIAALLISSIITSTTHAARPLEVKEVCGYELQANQVTTVANGSYIYLGLDRMPKDHLKEILGAVCAFELAHPELKVTDVDVDKQQSGGLGSNIGDQVFGVFLRHEPKQK